MENEQFSDIHGEIIAEGEFALFSMPNGIMSYGMLCGKRFILFVRRIPLALATGS
jgi:hypothetical protein